MLSGLRKHRAAASQSKVAPGCVSVVIPLYNHARFIAEAVQSVLAQGPILGELIVVDDGSTDQSAEIMRGLGDTDRRIIFWSQPNRGAHAALNAGLQRATGSYVAILNSDDAYAPGRLASLAPALEAEPGLDAAASGIAFINDAGEPILNPWYDEALAFFGACGDMGLALVNGNFLMTTSNFLLRRSLLDEIGAFAGLRYAHDLDFSLRLLAHGKRITWLPETLLRYRLHGHNTIHEDHGAVRLEWAIVAAFYLATLWDRPAPGAIDWRGALKAEDVLERHALSRAVHLAITYLRRYPTDTLERHPILFDQQFRAVLAGCL